MFDVRLLEQRGTYVAENDVHVKVVGMGAAYADRALVRLYAEAERMQSAWTGMLTESLAGLAGSRLMSLAQLRSLLAEANDEPQHWLSRRPLIAALSERTLSDLPVRAKVEETSRGLD